MDDICHLGAPLRGAIVLLLVTFLSMAQAQQQTSVRYTLGMSRPSTHLFEVELTFDALPASMESLDVLLPVWRPGRYVVLDFAGGVQDFSASAGREKQLTWSKAAKSIWRVQTGGSRRVVISYKVYANEFPLRTRGL